MALGDVKLGASGSEAVISAFGRTITVKDIETSRMKRTVDGTMKKDIIYRKKEFNLKYSSIFGDDLDQLLTIYDTITQPMSLIIVNGTDGSGGSETYSVYMKPSDRQRISFCNDDGLFSGVNFVLSEA